uniref:Meckel syndrome type 1 protein n=1 Tax=Hanusia phi TaxID=3032 RepID=A0A7S0EJ57_9CRYP|mmetsp:Transcript_25728/g.57856  ORF Transcript_25728/g.57856 Transcript_25728/m.57856 type:complete len:541 (+) Transcript_25728:156-1778(+)
MSAAEFLLKERTRRVRYRTDDPMSKLKIKVILEQKQGDNDEESWVRKERVFDWQEKVYGAEEFEMYSKSAEKTSAHDDQDEEEGDSKFRHQPPDYVRKDLQLARAETIYSYVNKDKFTALDQRPPLLNSLQGHTETKLAMLRDRPELLERPSRHGGAAAKSHPCTKMHIVADLTSDQIQTETGENVYRKQKFVLCEIRAYEDGTMDMTPGFSPEPSIKIDILQNYKYTQADLGTPYRIRTEGGFNYDYWIINDTEVPDEASKNKTIANERKYQEQLLSKAQELRKNFIGSEFDLFNTTDKDDECRMFVNIEIVSAMGFERDHLYVQYLVDIPEGWQIVESPDPDDSHPVWGNTALSTVRHKKSGYGLGSLLGLADGFETLDRVAHFAHPIHLELQKTRIASGGRKPVLLLQVNSYDRWDRQRVQGYGHVILADETSFCEHKVSTWTPTPSQVGRMRSFFIGGSPELKDFRFAGLEANKAGNILSRYGFSTESSGDVMVRVSTVVQSANFLRSKGSGSAKIEETAGLSGTDAEMKRRSKVK